jgi:hypothetical protein
VIQLARECRRVVRYDEVPLVVRHAILAAEDKDFCSHSGVDYGALPRVIQKTAARTLAEWRNGRSRSCGSRSGSRRPCAGAYLVRPVTPDPTAQAGALD